MSRKLSTALTAFYALAGTLKLLDVNMFGMPAHTGRPAVASASDCCFACADTPGNGCCHQATALSLSLMSSTPCQRPLQWYQGGNDSAQICRL